MATSLVMRKKRSDHFKKEKTERGMATSILTPLPEGDGEMTTSLFRREKQRDYFGKEMAERGLATSTLTLLPCGDGGMATSTLLILLLSICR